MSAGSLIGYGLLFLFAGLVVALLAPIVDSTNTVSDAMISSGLPVSQERIDTLFILESAFGIIGVCTLVAGGINLWVNSVRESNQEV